MLPAKHWTGWEVAREMMVHRRDASGFQRSKWVVRSLKYTDVSLKTVQVTGAIESHTVSSEVVKRAVEPKGKLEEAMRECTEPVKKRRRVRRKMKDATKRTATAGGSDASNPTESAGDGESTDSHQSAVSVHGPSSAAAPAPSAARGGRPVATKFFREDQLGVIGVDDAKTGRSMCKICSARITI